MCIFRFHIFDLCSYIAWNKHYFLEQVLLLVLRYNINDISVILLKFVSYHVAGKVAHNAYINVKINTFKKCLCIFVIEYLQYKCIYIIAQELYTYF